VDRSGFDLVAQHEVDAGVTSSSVAARANWHTDGDQHRGHDERAKLTVS
jgi:hypothetical protein